MYKKEAAKGAGWLDVNNPGWVNKISVKSLNLAKFESCVLGQVYGEYEAIRLSSQGGLNWAVKHGFILPTREKRFLFFLTAVLPPNRSDYAKLTAAWSWEISRRQAAQRAIEEAEQTAALK